MTYASPENLTGVGDLITYANTVSDNLFGYGVLISLYIVIISYLIIRGEDVPSSFTVAGFITTFLSIIMFFGGWVDMYAVAVPVILLALSMIWTFFDRSG